MTYLQLALSGSIHERRPSEYLPCLCLARHLRQALQHGDQATLHCPDFCEDITLRKPAASQEPPPEKESPE